MSYQKFQTLVIIFADLSFIFPYSGKMKELYNPFKRNGSYVSLLRFVFFGKFQ
jgi:hypothetical protein